MTNYDEIVVIAVACIAEELGTDVHSVKVVSFKEITEFQEEKNEYISHQDEWKNL